MRVPPLPVPQHPTTTMGNRHISEDVKQITLKLWEQG